MTQLKVLTVRFYKPRKEIFDSVRNSMLSFHWMTPMRRQVVKDLTLSYSMPSQDCLFLTCRSHSCQKKWFPFMWLFYLMGQVKKQQCFPISCKDSLIEKQHKVELESRVSGPKPSFISNRNSSLKL